MVVVTATGCGRVRLAKNPDFVAEGCANRKGSLPRRILLALWRGDAKIADDPWPEATVTDFIRVPCPACGDALRVAAEQVGKLAKCPHCQKALRVPAPPLPGRFTRQQSASRPDGSTGRKSWYKNDTVIVVISSGLTLAIVCAIASALWLKGKVETAREEREQRASQEERLAGQRDDIIAKEEAARVEQRRLEENKRSQEARHQARAEREQMLADLETRLQEILRQDLFSATDPRSPTRNMAQAKLEKKVSALESEFLSHGGTREEFQKRWDRIVAEENDRVFLQWNRKLAREQKERDRVIDTAVQVTATKLIQEYHDNEVDADNKYKGQWLRVRGTVSRVTKPLFGSDGCTVYLKSDVQFTFGDVGCSFESAISGEGVRRGFVDEICGKCTGMTLGSVFLRECAWAQ
jgi:hypothetical protein